VATEAETTEVVVDWLQRASSLQKHGAWAIKTILSVHENGELITLLQY